MSERTEAPDVLAVVNGLLSKASDLLTESHAPTEEGYEAEREILQHIAKAGKTLTREQQRQREGKAISLRPAMLEGQPGGHEELWIVDPPPDRGPEGNLRMWEEAEDYLELLMDRADRERNEAIDTALCDAYNRAIEERRRAEDLLKLHEKWANRRIGGVVEPVE